MVVSAEPGYILFEQTGSIARITLNRPEKLNAINYEVGLQLWQALARCEDDPSIRAIILAGAGRAFCAGDELGREHAPDEEEYLRRRGRIKHYVSGPRRWTSTVRLMRGLSQPIVARLQGYVYGAGYEGWGQSPDAAYWHQGSAVAEADNLEDLAEGVAAFKAKRPPRFTGR